jgi:hypothetical protein
MIMKRKDEKKKKIDLPGIIAAAGIGIIEFLEVFLLYRKVRNGEVISVRLSSGDPAAFIL